ncbi:MAG: helix-turn-helix domain-containing protein [Chloroflexi bacterium]|nr:helix-turn-helix domain-containing protein [Chloroflexota bacterium]
MIFVFGGRTQVSDYVETIWRTQSDAVGGSFISTAGYNWEIVVTKQYGGINLTVRGPETRAILAPVPKDADFLGITFKLGTYMPHLPAINLLNGGLDLPEASSKSFWLNGSAWQFPEYDTAEVFVNRLIRAGLLVRDDLVTGILHNQPQYASIRTIRRRFLQATGLPHKTIQQIQRAQQAALLLRGGKPILDTVYETGYFDQAHMTKSLKYFMGQTPAQILSLDDVRQSSFNLTGTR